MSKYALVGLCLLAFAAGGLAQLALHKTRGTSGRAEHVAQPAGAAAPEAAEKAAEAPAPAAGVADAAPAEAPPPADEEAAETAEVGAEEVGAVAEEAGGAVVGRPGGVRRQPRRRARGDAHRASAARIQPVRRTPPAPRPPASAYAGGGLHHKTAKGAKKTGSWLGRKLKKVGDVFHD